MRHAEKHEWPKAVEVVSQSKNTVLRKVVDWAYLREPGPHANFTQRTAFLAANPTWPAQIELRRQAEDTIEPSVASGTLAAWFDSHAPLSSPGRVAYARALRALGRMEEARKFAREAWLSGVFDKNDEREFLRDFADVLTPQDHWARIDRILYDEQTSAAERTLPLVDADHGRLARARMALISGTSSFDTLFRAVPPALQSDLGLLYSRIRWRRQHNDTEGAVALMPPFPIEGPRADLWWQERQMLARDALARGHVTEAYQLASNQGAQDPASVSEAEWLAGWIALRFLKDGEAALPHFEKAYDTGQTPASMSRGAYWMGRATEALGRSDIAADWYKRAATYITTFYGQLALARMKGGTVPSLPADPVPTPEERAAFEAKDLTQALRALLEADAQSYQRAFALALAESSGFAVERQMVAELLNRHARPDLGIVVARGAAREKIILLEYGYPIPPYGYPAIPEKALMLAVTRQESNFDPGAVSFSGARGLMQLMPDTAKQLAKIEKLPYARAKLVTDPAYNLRLGGAYLNALVSNFNGSYILAAAAYNAGPGRTRQWIRQLGDPQEQGVDPIDWIEQIPFNETRSYVQRVMENVMIYRAQLGGTQRVSSSLEAELGRKQIAAAHD